MAEIYEVIIKTVLTCIGLLAAWFSLDEGIKTLARLPSKAELLFSEFDSLASWKGVLRKRIDNLISDESKVMSEIAAKWLDSVDELNDSINRSDDSIKNKLDGRKSSWYDFFGLRQRYKLATKVNECSAKVKKLEEMRDGFKDEDLIADASEFTRAILAVWDKVMSFKKVWERLVNMARDLEKKIKPLENDVRERDGLVSCWFRRTHSLIHSWEEAFPEYPSMIRRLCNGRHSPSSPSCPSFAGACDACRDKYAIWKEVERLTPRCEGLCGEGYEYLRNTENCVSTISELMAVSKKLEANCSSLESRRKSLENTKDVVKERVCSALRSFQQLGREMEVSSNVTRWFEHVNSLIRSFSEASRKWKQMRNEAPTCSRKEEKLTCCNYSISEACHACRKNYELGKKVEGILQESQRLEEEANGEHFKDAHKLVVEVRFTDVEFIPISTEVFGQEEELKTALELIKEDGSVGIWGMCGVGKTTLLHRINNYFHQNKNPSVSFDVVLFVTAGSDACIQRVQADIGERLGISNLSDSGDKGKQAREISKSLQTKNFLLLVDDVWEEIDLRWLGVPMENGKQRKRKVVVIATRYHHLCPWKKTITMRLLSGDLSWKLFCTHVDNDNLLQGDPEIQRLARGIVHKCDGLPLALFNIGKLMSSAHSKSQWNVVGKKLRNSAHTCKEMKDKVLVRLKSSFERLEDDAMRDILFLCLCQSEISVGHDQFMDIKDIAKNGLMESMHDVGDESIIDEYITQIIALVKSGLLVCRGRVEKLGSDISTGVRLHDCVGDMLDWLIDSEKDKYLEMVRWSSGKGLCFEKWERAGRITMDGCHWREIPENVEIPNCRLLFSFTAIASKFVRLPSSFFCHMPFLRVLSFSHSRDLEELPESIGSLVNLRYLDLSYMHIRKLPKGMQYLKQLICLKLACTCKLRDIPQECFSGLDKLQDYVGFECAFEWSWDRDDGGDSKQASLHDIRKLMEDGALRRTDIDFKVDEGAIMKNMADSPRLLRSIQEMTVDFRNFMEDVTSLLIKNMEKMESLVKLKLQHIPEYFHPDFRGPFTLARLFKYFPAGLKYLEVRKCENLIGLLSSSEEDESRRRRRVESSPSSKELPIRVLMIEDCPKLNCIANKSWQFPKLEGVTILLCPELKHVPFNHQNAPKLGSINLSDRKVLMTWLIGQEEVECFWKMMGSLGGKSMLIEQEDVIDWLVFLRECEGESKFFEQKVKKLKGLKEGRMMEYEYNPCSERAKQWFEKVDSFICHTSRVFFDFTSPLGGGKETLINYDDTNIAHVPGGEICLPRMEPDHFIRDHGKELLQFYQGVIARENKLMEEEGMLDLTNGDAMQLESRDRTLGIEPFELRFPLKLLDKVSCSLQLSNNTDQCVEFHVCPQSMDQREYRVRPDTGIVMPQSTVDVMVEMNIHDDLWNCHGKCQWVPKDLLEFEDKFTVQLSSAKKDRVYMEEESKNTFQECDLPAYDHERVPQDVLEFKDKHMVHSTNVVKEDEDFMFTKEDLPATCDEEFPEDMLECEEKHIVESTVSKEDQVYMFTEESKSSLEECNLPIMYDVTSLDMSTHCQSYSGYKKFILSLMVPNKETVSKLNQELDISTKATL